MPAIQVQNISKQFGSHTAVNNLSLEVQAGEIYGFLGPNGSGKSTTLRMILSLLKHDGGSIAINGFDIDKNRQHALQHIGCIIEKPDFYSYLSAVDNLKIFARMHGVDSSTKSCNALLQQVGLAGREADKVKTYSHGMKQRLGLAQALLHNPSIIVLDEPNTGLDPNGIIELRETIINLNVQQGKTILISSHILSEVEDIAHSMILINKGKTIAQGNVSDLLSTEQLMVSYSVTDVQGVQQLLQHTAWQQYVITDEHQELCFNLSLQQIPELNTWMASQNIAIYGIEKKRRLERYFLKLTEA
jgi:ABC-type multidrug transport system ATPase subunit